MINGGNGETHNGCKFAKENESRTKKRRFRGDTFLSSHHIDGLTMGRNCIKWLGALLIWGFIIAGCQASPSSATPTENSSSTAVAEIVQPSPTRLPTQTAIPTALPTILATPLEEVSAETAVVQPTSTPSQPLLPLSGPRGYMTTPQELALIREKAAEGLQPYQRAVEDTLRWAERPWKYEFAAHEPCKSANSPAWLDNGKGAPLLYSKALAYHLTGDDQYAEEVATILEMMMTQVETISLDEQRCRLVFAWGTPELVASADLIESYWQDRTCTGPISYQFDEDEQGEDNCKRLYQNWLVKNPYYIISHSAIHSQSNWGAASTNATAHIADYVWDRPGMLLVHRGSVEANGSETILHTPAEAYAFANQLALDRMNGLRVEFDSSDSCDYLEGRQQNDNFEPVKSQITADGIIPEDARRMESCNVPVYDGRYQNYPQLHLGHNIQQCELMLRRGDSSCYDNVATEAIPEFTYIDPDGVSQTTRLEAGRGSIERAIYAILIDANTDWRHNSALEVAYRYYINHHTLPGIEFWFQSLEWPNECAQDICFATLTHGFAPGERPSLPPMVPPPGQTIDEDS